MLSNSFQKQNCPYRFFILLDFPVIIVVTHGVVRKWVNKREIYKIFGYPVFLRDYKIVITKALVTTRNTNLILILILKFKNTMYSFMILVASEKSRLVLKFPSYIMFCICLNRKLEVSLQTWLVLRFLILRP